MRERVEARLRELRAEFDTGQARLRELELEETRLREVLLRISGAIQALQEVLDEPKVAPASGAADAPGSSPGTPSAGA